LLDELRRQEELLRKKNEPIPEPQLEPDVHDDDNKQGHNRVIFLDYV